MKVLVLTLLSTLAAFAQTAQITGAVSDSSHAAMPNVSVTVSNVETGITRRTSTNEQGYYTVPLLQPGHYQVTAQADGFKPISRDHITLEVDQVVRIDFVMEVGAVTERLTISAAAPLLETSNASTGQVIESKQFTDLPLNNRSALGLLTLSDGVVAGRQFDPNTFNTANSFSANGSRAGQNEILLDGAPNSLPGVWPGRGILGTPVPVDAVQEVKVQTTIFSAEFGRTGGGLVNMVTRSGTNDWHGGAFEFLRNSALDSNDFFNNRNGIALGSFKRNQFGGTLGGPVRLPKIYDGHNRTFFFVNYQGTRAVTGATSVMTVPTAATRRGDFSALQTAQGQAVLLYDPLTTTTVAGTPTRQPFAGNIVPAARIDPVSARIVGYYPQPNQPGSVNNLVQGGASPENVDQFGLRLDHVLTSRQQINGRYNYTRDDSTNPDWFHDIARGNTGLNQLVNSAAVDYINTLGPATVLDVRYGYTDRTHINLNDTIGIDLTSLGFPSYVSQAAGLRIFPRVTPSGYGVMGSSDGVNAFSYIDHAWQGSVTHTKGAHTMKFGADLRLHIVAQDRGIDPSGTYTFSKAFTQGPNANRGGATLGDSIASMLLGTPATGVFGTAIHVQSNNRYYGFYFQDDWKVTPRLTLNLGLRYELEMPRVEDQNRLDWFDYNVVSPLNDQVKSLGTLHGGMRFAADPGNPRTQFNTDWNNFGPRAGFAYQLDKSTVLRAGFGIFYASGSIGAAGFNIASQGYAPSTTYVGSQDGLTPISTWSNPYPNGFAQAVGNSQGLLSLVGQSVARVYDRQAPLPYNEQWSFSLQRQVKSILIQTAYNGSRGIHLGDGAGFDINQLPGSALALGSALQQLVTNPFYGIVTNPGVLRNATVTRGQLLRPYPQFDGLTVFNPAAAASTYHGVSIKAERRFASGLGFLASYTASKNLTDAPATTGPAAGHQNMYDRRADRSLFEDDSASRFVGSVSYELPLGKGKALGTHWSRFTDTLLGGWQVNAIISMQSGFPLAITNSPNSSGALGGTQRPNATGISAAKDGSVQSRLNAFVNAAAFSAPDPFSFGNVSRTLPNVRGPRSSNLDMSLFKVFPLTEQVRLQFRAETFNATNTPIFGLPNQSFGSAAFGTISGTANNPRQIQFGLRLLF